MLWCFLLKFCRVTQVWGSVSQVVLIILTSGTTLLSSSQRLYLEGLQPRTDDSGKCMHKHWFTRQSVFHSSLTQLISALFQKRYHCYAQCLMLSSLLLPVQGEWLYRPGKWHRRQRCYPQWSGGSAKGGRRSGQTVYTTQEERHGENHGYKVGQRA